MSKTVLVLAYFFPPVGGAGVQRVTKFVKYLPECGWEPVVLTVENPSVPLFDESLLAEVPETVKIHKAKTREPGYKTKQSVSASTDSESGGAAFKTAIKTLIRKLATILLQPDPQVLWFPAAYRKACAILTEQPVDAIFATAPPFSSLVLGARLAKKFKVPLILDYRDEWDISNSIWENKRLDRFSLAIQKRMQNYAIKHASSIIATTSLSANTLKEKAVHLNPDCEVLCIYNGYDAADFPALDHPVTKDNEFYDITYVGTLWNLTSIEPVVKALTLLSERREDLAKKLRLIVAGRRTAEQQAIVDKVERLPVNLQMHDYLEHADSIALMRQSRGLLLLLSDVGMSKRVVPGKLFEYIVTNNSILAIAPQGEVWELLKDYPSACCIEPSDTESTVNFLVDAIDSLSAGTLDDMPQYNGQQFERKELTHRLAQVPDRVTS